MGFCRRLRDKVSTSHGHGRDEINYGNYIHKGQEVRFVGTFI